MATNNLINQHKPIPLFFAYLNASTGAVTGDGTNVNPVPFNSVSFNDGSFSTVTYLFTAPRDGIYLLNSSITASNANGKTALSHQFWVNAAPLMTQAKNPNLVTVGTNIYGQVNGIVQMTAAQTAYVLFSISGGAKNCAIISAGAADPRTWFSATLIG